MNEFQERLCELLAEKNISKLKLAKDLNISDIAIYRYFTRDFYPRIDIANLMANYFDCSLDYLFGLSDERNNKNANAHSFWHNFNALLSENGYSIRKAFSELNMSTYDYYRWKTQFPKTRALIEIAKFFSVSVDYLVGDIKKYRDIK